MAAIIYVLAALLAGLELTGILFDENTARGGAVNALWLRLCAGFGCGILLTTWGLYLTAWIIHVQGGVEQPLLYANILVLTVIGIILFFAWRPRFRKHTAPSWTQGWITDKGLFRKECIF